MKEQIKQALDKATPGQWEVKTDKFFSNCKGIYSNGFYIGGGMREQDAELIRNTPTWIRWQNERIDKLLEVIDIAVMHLQNNDLMVKAEQIKRLRDRAMEVRA